MASVVDELELVNGIADRGLRSDGSDGKSATKDGEDRNGGRSRAARKAPRIRAGSRTKLKWGVSLENAAREYVWLCEVRRGVSNSTIARRERVSLHRVQLGLKRALAQEQIVPGAKPLFRPPRLVPLFPIGAFTPTSLCAHRQPLRIGSELCCMVCHLSGMDKHPALQRDKAKEPAPEPVPSVPKPKTARESRKQRRRRLFAALA